MSGLPLTGRDGWECYQQKMSSAHSSTPSPRQVNRLKAEQRTVEKCRMSSALDQLNTEVEATGRPNAVSCLFETGNIP